MSCQLVQPPGLFVNLLNSWFSLTESGVRWQRCCCQVCQLEACSNWSIFKTLQPFKLSITIHDRITVQKLSLSSDKHLKHGVTSQGSEVTPWEVLCCLPLLFIVYCLLLLFIVYCLLFIFRCIPEFANLLPIVKPFNQVLISWFLKFVYITVNLELAQ